MKKLSSLLFIFMLFFTLFCCSKEKKDEIKIVYTNDIHSYIANEIKDNDNVKPGLRINNVSGYVKKLKEEYENVLLIDAGDIVQGSIYGALDQGVGVLNIMNNAGYQLATPGNHDFDYGMDSFNGFIKEAKFPFISCNFKDKDNKNILDSTKIFELGDKKIGFVGISTPETITSSTPTFFQNEKGEFIYSFDGLKDKNDLYKSVQAAIDSIKDKVDYVIALGHLGVGIDEAKLGIRSIDVINNTTGLDAFIDGHSHTIIEKEMIKSKDNKDVLLTQTGSYLSNIGVMEIKDNTINTTLIPNVEEIDDNVKKLEDALITKVNNQLGVKIATLDKALYINNPSNDKQRIIRARETNMGNITSDSIYWYINEYKKLDCDIVINNGGGIRTGLNQGDLSYLSCKSVMPFGNQVCLIKTKGINIKNALEMGSTVIGDWDTEWDCPAENGGFIHPSGLKYEIDASLETNVKTDENKMFASVDGEYKVKNIMVYNKQTKVYEALEDDKLYTVGGINYLLRNSGNGLSMFNNSELVLDYIEEDYTVFANYLMEFNKDNNLPKINNQNSPLKSYTNYLYDYENPNGSGRIKILNLNK